MDCDSLVTRFDFTIEHIVGEHLHDLDKHIIITRGETPPLLIHCNRHDLLSLTTFAVMPDLSGLNSGVMALRCTEWNRALWRRVWKAEQYIKDPWAEQRALIEFYKAEPEVCAWHTRNI